MGISINIAKQMVRIAPLLKNKQNGIMLGRQKMHFRQFMKTDLIDFMAQNGMPAALEDLFFRDHRCEPFLNAIGWPPLQSLDFSDIEGAEFIHDLSKPIPADLAGKFDVIFDGGTTEHVFDIARAFDNAHRMLKDDGIFVSVVGTDGWYGHGFYQVGPDIPWRYWHATLGYDVLGCWTMPRKLDVLPEPVEDPTGKRGGATRRFRAPQFLFYVVQKNGEQPDCPPTIQSHYVDY